MDLYTSQQYKGGIVKFKMDEGIDAKSIVDIDGLAYDNAFLVDFHMGLMERFSVMPCFGGSKYLFAYGNDMTQSRTQVTLLVFFATNVPICKYSPRAGINVYKDLLDWYDANRLSKGKRVKLTILSADKFTQGVIVGFQVDAYNANMNAVAVTFTYVPLED